MSSYSSFGGIHGGGRELLEGDVEFSPGLAGSVGGTVSHGVLAVGSFDRSVGAPGAVSAGGVETLVGRGGVGQGADGADCSAFAPFLVVTERLAVAALGLRVDGEAVFKATTCVEEHEVAED